MRAPKSKMQRIHVTESKDGSLKRVTTTINTGRALMLVAKPGKEFYIRNGTLSPCRHPGSIASARLFLRVPEAGPEEFVTSIAHATPLPFPENWLPRIIEMVQINTGVCSHIEIGNTRASRRIEVPPATKRQLASLRARKKADRTGRPQPVRE